MATIQADTNTVVIDGKKYIKSDEGHYVPAPQRKKRNAIFREGEELTVADVIGRLEMFSDAEDYTISVERSTDGFSDTFVLNLNCEEDKKYAAADNRVVFLSEATQEANRTGQ